MKLSGTFVSINFEGALVAPCNVGFSSILFFGGLEFN